MTYLSTLTGFWHNLWNDIRYKTDIIRATPFNNKEIKRFLRFRV